MFIPEYCPYCGADTENVDTENLEVLYVCGTRLSLIQERQSSICKDRMVHNHKVLQEAQEIEERLGHDRGEQSIDAELIDRVRACFSSEFGDNVGTAIDLWNSTTGKTCLSRGAITDSRSFTRVFQRTFFKAYSQIKRASLDTATKIEEMLDRGEDGRARAKEVVPQWIENAMVGTLFAVFQARELEMMKEAQDKEGDSYD